MRAGEFVGDYRLLEDFRVVGAGLSEWSFAEREGRHYFIKRFLSPTYPDDAAPGSPRTKARKRARCAAFEAHHRGIQAALAPVTGYGGNLIATLDFFRWGAKYYKVTEKVDVAGLSAAEVRALPFPARLVLLKTVAHSLKILHDLRIVHSDLKPSNVLIKRTELGHTTKLIDFDSSYIAGGPPPPEEIVGTMNYYSPELLRYVQELASPAELTAASDIFALGLIYTEYLTGSLPPFDPAHHEAATAVLHGQRLTLPREHAADVPHAVADIVDAMLAADASARPDIGQVHAELMTVRSGTATRARVIGAAPAARPEPRAASATPASTTAASTTTVRTTSRTPAPGSRLRGKGLRVAYGELGPAAVEPTAVVPTPATPGPRRRPLVGRLLGKLTRGGDAT